MDRGLSFMKTVLITGASRGLGAQLAHAFSKRGYEVIGIYRRSKKEALLLEEQIQGQGGKIELIQADISLSDDVNRLFNLIRERWGEVHMLVNNAGIVQDQNIVRMSENDWDEVMAVNLKGPFLCTQAYARWMGFQDVAEKAILNVASSVGLRGNVGQSNYAASKAGLLSLTHSSAAELRPYGIRVNAVIPGILSTTMTQGVQDLKKKAEERPLGEIAKAIVFLSGLGQITGQIFTLEDRVLSHESFYPFFTCGGDRPWVENSDGRKSPSGFSVLEGLKVQHSLS